MARMRAIPLRPFSQISSSGSCNTLLRKWVIPFRYDPLFSRRCRVLIRWEFAEQVEHDILIYKNILDLLIKETDVKTEKEDTAIEHLDVLIVGAGISGICMAYYLQT